MIEIKKLSKENLLVLLIIGLGAFLRFYRLDELMPFIPDQGWFYLSARDMVIKGEIPLVGPPTSHPWIHHGALWTYVLAAILFIFNFNPIPPAYSIALLGAITVWLMYKVSSELFSKRIGLIAAMLFASSPLIVLNSRMPYHTSPIPFFAILLFYSVYKWIKGNVLFFPIISFLAAILYNHELTTFVLVIPIFLFFIYGFWNKEKWARGILDKKVIVLSLITFLIPMTPFVLYDINHGFKQTLGFALWILFRVIRFPIYLFNSSNSSDLLAQYFSEFLMYLKQLIVAPSLMITMLVLSVSVGYLLLLFFKKLTSSSLDIKTTLVFSYFFIPLLGLFMHRIPIEADILLISPFIILTVSVLFDKIMSSHFFSSIMLVFIPFISLLNIHYLLSTEYLTLKSNERRLTISDQLRATDSIIKIAKGRDYNVIFKGELDFFPAFAMPYEYLLWWKGHSFKKESVDLKIVLWEKDGEIIVYQQE